MVMEDGRNVFSFSFYGHQKFGEIWCPFGQRAKNERRSWWAGRKGELHCQTVAEEQRRRHSGGPDCGGGEGRQKKEKQLQ